jgi:penicillin-binding protein 1C
MYAADIGLFYEAVKFDEFYIGETKSIHQMQVAPEPGKHVLTLVDELGGSIQRKFIVLSK